MKKNFRIFLLFSKYAFKSAFQHPLGTFAFLIGKLLRFGLYFLFIYYLLHKTKILAGYDINQTLIFFITFSIIDSASQLLFREVYRFRPLIVKGELDAVLIKPYHPFMRILVGGADILDLVTVFLYIGILIYFVLQLPVVSIMSVFLFICMIINGLVIATAFHIIVLALGIFTTEIDHAIMIYRDMTRLGTLPIDIYQEPIKSFFTFVIPVGIMMTFPVKSLLGMLSWEMIAISFLISFILLIGSLALWDSALKKYQSWGG